MITSLKSFGIVSSYKILDKNVWNVSRISGPAPLKVSAGRPSIPDALFIIVCFIAFLTSSKVGGRSMLSTTALCGIKSKATDSRVECLFSRLEKYSLHHSMMLDLSLSKEMSSEISKGVVLGYEEQYTTFQELKAS